MAMADHIREVERRSRPDAARVIADSLTLARFAAAALIVSLGLAVGPPAMLAAIGVTMFGWLTDVLDGPIGRRSKSGMSAVARSDFIADCALGYSFFLFVVLAGLFPAWAAIVLVVVNLTAVFLKPTKPVMLVVSAPYFALPIVQSFGVSAALGFCYLTFLASVAYVCRDKLKLNASSARESATEATPN